jgi:hypothetical protein
MPQQTIKASIVEPMLLGITPVLVVPETHVPDGSRAG